jgi:hypothetical protein
MTSVPTVSDGDADDPVWYPLQYALGIDTFGVNLFIASRADQTLVEEHDERASGQQELYLLIEGEAVFDLDDEHVHLNLELRPLQRHPPASLEHRGLGQCSGMTPEEVSPAVDKD